MTGKDRQNYTPSESADGAVTCSGSQDQDVERFFGRKRKVWLYFDNAYIPDPWIQLLHLYCLGTSLWSHCHTTVHVRGPHDVIRTLKHIGQEVWLYHSSRERMAWCFSRWKSDGSSLNHTLCFDFFSLVEIFLSSHEPFQHGASIPCCIAVLFEVQRLIAATTLVCCIKLHTVVSTSTQLPSL